MNHTNTYYFDSNATTRVAPEVLAEMLPYWQDKWGNPSSPHRMGRSLAEPLQRARNEVAALIGADPSEVIFTSCGTESINTAIQSAIHSQPGKRHIITTAVEHSATLRCSELMESRGYKVTYLGVSKEGLLDLTSLEAAIRPDTAIVSIMWANNETGVLFPISDIAAICRRKGVLLHTDAVQVPGKIPIDVKDLGTDMLSLSAHKLHGPKGVGLLYVREGTPFTPLIVGGHQEEGNRGGTENVPYLIGFGKAASLASAVTAENRKALAQLRDFMEDEILTKVPGTARNGAKEPRLPNTASISFAGVDSEALLMLLDQVRICASSGSACTTGSSAPSHVLMAMGLTPSQARSTLRISLDYESTIEEVRYLIQHLTQLVPQLRSAASPRLVSQPANP